MDLYKAMEARRSIRRMKETPVEPEKIELLKRSVYLSPSACNRQPYKMLFVRDGGVIGKIRNICAQPALQHAPLIVVGLVNRPAAWRMSAEDPRGIADFDLAIAFEHLALTAAAEGLGSCYIGAFDTAAIDKLLGVAAPWTAEMMLPIGYPDMAPSAFVRKNIGELCEDI